jgi:hypothetical protein
MLTPETERSAFPKLSIRLLSPASLYDDWFVAETEASLALLAWREARSSGAKARAYASYVAALGREERAAGLLAARLNAA